MRKFYSALCAIFMLNLWLTELAAQEVVSTAGNEASGNGGVVSYTIGQVVYATNTGETGSVSEGVQQAFEVSVVNSLDETMGINIILSAYPNPTTDYFTLNVDTKDNLEISSLSYKMYDLNGKLLLNKSIKSNLTEISMKDFSPASYIFMVFKNNQAVKIFKIIKK